MKPICFLFLSVTRINPCLKQSDLEKSPQNDSLYCIYLPPSFVNFVPQENNFTARQARLSIACMKPFPLFEQHPT